MMFLPTQIVTNCMVAKSKYLSEGRRFAESNIRKRYEKSMREIRTAEPAADGLGLAALFRHLAFLCQTVENAFNDRLRFLEPLRNEPVPHSSTNSLLLRSLCRTLLDLQVSCENSDTNRRNWELPA